MTNTSYILDRLRSDSRHVLQQVRNAGQIGHPGAKGRFRELLLKDLLLPWLPPSVSGGTGVIVDHRQRVGEAGQDDIILFDSLLTPRILAAPQSAEGVYLCDGVLCRIEVKSKVAKSDL